jgi:hypothetical protein
MYLSLATYRKFHSGKAILAPFPCFADLRMQGVFVAVGVVEQFPFQHQKGLSVNNQPGSGALLLKMGRGRKRVADYRPVVPPSRRLSAGNCPTMNQ